MLTFDKIKLVVPLEAIISINKDKWEMTVEGSEVTKLTYCQRTPCLVSLRVDYKKEKMVVEFTGKILKDDYPLLISQKTIRKCLGAIGAIGIGEFDIDYIMSNAKVTQCDITRDIVVEDYRGLITTIETHIKQPRRWSIRHYGETNIVIEKNVKSSNSQRRLSIYDKGDELSKDQDFLGWVCNPDDLVRRFTGKKRFEFRLTSSLAIRKVLGIDDNYIIEVLESKASPFIDYFKDLLKESVSTGKLSRKSMRIYNMESTLIRNNWDLSQIETILRQTHPKFRSKMLDEYRELIDEHNKQAMSHHIDFHEIFEEDDTETHFSVNTDEKYWQLRCCTAPKGVFR